MNSEFIRDYLMEKFKDNSRLSSTGSELVVPSCFAQDDYNRHMSINVETGLWQCFKTGRVGNFFQLYAFLEGITYNRAKSEMLFKEFSGLIPKAKPKVEEAITYPSEDMGLLEVRANSHESSNPLVVRAWAFLIERNLITEDSLFYVSYDSESRYEGRLIIPFMEDGELFYFQARSLDEQRPKYLNPSEGWPKGSHILYPFDEEASEVLVCEGPLDARSLQDSGVNATCTLGSSVSDQQIEILRDFKGKIVIAYDNDPAGQHGINKFDYLRRLKRMADLFICHPPSDVKDWNEALIKGIDLQQFVADHTRKYDYDYLVDHLLTTL